MSGRSAEFTHRFLQRFGAATVITKRNGTTLALTPSQYRVAARLFSGEYRGDERSLARDLRMPRSTLRDVIDALATLWVVEVVRRRGRGGGTLLRFVGRWRVARRAQRTDPSSPVESTLPEREVVTRTGRVRPLGEVLAGLALPSRS